MLARAVEFDLSDFMSNPLTTNPSIFLRLRQSDPAPREVAWAQFHARYAPIIAGFALRLGARPQELDDIVQDVMLGFFACSPSFIYDPSKGRFRGYLKVCTCHAVAERLGKNRQHRGVPLDRIDPAAVSIEQEWNSVWEQELFQRAMQSLRTEIGHTKSFRAFERYVARGESAETIAADLNVHLTSVYRAKREVTAMLRQRVQTMDEDED